MIHNKTPKSHQISPLCAVNVILSIFATATVGVLVAGRIRHCSQAWNHPKADRLYVEEATDDTPVVPERSIFQEMEFWKGLC